nr:MAG TPA_asm: hypothetical protein [Caudoviricetes sp.]
MDDCVSAMLMPLLGVSPDTSVTDKRRIIQLQTDCVTT